jgi:hypothetical protein
MVKTDVDERQKLHESVAMMVHFGTTGLVQLSTALLRPFGCRLDYSSCHLWDLSIERTESCCNAATVACSASMMPGHRGAGAAAQLA